MCRWFVALSFGVVGLCSPVVAQSGSVRETVSTSLQQTVNGWIEALVNVVFEPYWGLGVVAGADFGDNSSQGNNFGLAPTAIPNETSAEYFASEFDEAVGPNFEIFSTNGLSTALKIGARGPLDANLVCKQFFGCDFDDSKDASETKATNEGVFGLTPVVGGSVSLGNDFVTARIASESGFYGPRNGWQGAISLGVNLVDNPPAAYPSSRPTFGIADLGFGASLSAIDKTFAEAAYPSASAASIKNFNLQALSVNARLSVDLGGGFRASLPVEYRHYLGVVPADETKSSASLGFQLGYRFE